MSPQEVATVDVKAAGGVVWRLPGPLIAVIHRPHRGDWSLPKGKLDAGEGFEAAALREVREETGLTCRLGAELEPIFYRDRKGRSKAVRYWVMEAIEGEFEPGDEVDELRWLPSGDAIELLTYEHDRELVRTVGARLPVT